MAKLRVQVYRKENAVEPKVNLMVRTRVLWKDLVDQSIFQKKN